MAHEVIETIYGKLHKFEIIKDSRTFTTKFLIYRDGKYYRGEFSSLKDAVEVARKEG
jgi:hypothetical protein